MHQKFADTLGHEQLERPLAIENTPQPISPPTPDDSDHTDGEEDEESGSGGSDEEPGKKELIEKLGAEVVTKIATFSDAELELLQQFIAKRQGQHEGE